MFKVLRNYVSNKACEVACSVSFIQKLLEFLSFSLVDELKIVILLINELPFNLIDPLLFCKDICKNYCILSATWLRALIKGETRYFDLTYFGRMKSFSFGHFCWTGLACSCCFSVWSHKLIILVIIIWSIFLSLQGREINFGLLLVFAWIRNKTKPSFEWIEITR